MSEPVSRDDQVDEIMLRARAAETSIQQLCRGTAMRPRMTPADVSAILADLANATAALPQLARQLGETLDQAKHDYLLEMDTMAEGDDPAQAVKAARLRLSAIRGPALELYRLLDAAQSETAHIAAVDRPVKFARRGAAGTSPVRRPESPAPSTTVDGPSCPGPSR